MAEIMEQKAGFQKIGLFLGPVFALLILFTDAPADMSPEAWKVVALGAWMATWWATEAIPVPATSLIPLVYLPLLKITTISEASFPFASPVIFLLLGGFIIAMAMQRWNLHRRIALHILRVFTGSPALLVGGFMVASAVLSMWVSNTATTLMMIPIALSVSEAVTKTESERKLFTVALLLGVAYAASIGGFGTLVGTPPNAMVAAYLHQEMDIEVGFTQWMGIGVPTVMVFLPIAWLLLTRVAFPLKKVTHGQSHDHIEKELKRIGPITTPEKRTAMLFALIAISWIVRPLLKKIGFLETLSDTNIAVAGAILMFLIPAGSRKNEGAFLLNWDWAVRLPWGVILLFGGGLSLAKAIDLTELSVWLGESLTVLTTFHVFLLILALVALVVYLTELTSNTATTAGLLPVLGAIAVSGNMDPMILAAPAALAASCAFMLPVATAPNAIVYSSGHVSIPQMTRAGFWINMAAIATISVLSYALIPVVFG